MDGTTHRQGRAIRLDALLDQLDASLRAGDITDLATTETGFKVLDEVIGGGLHAGDLVLVGGPPGVGKTIATLQMARHIARSGGTAVFVCYEHEEPVLATRLLALEAAASDAVPDGPALQAAGRVSGLLLRGAEGRRGLANAVAAEPALAQALERLRTYAGRLTLMRASGSHTGIPEIQAVLDDLRDRTDRPPVLFVDYLQKVPVRPEPPTEVEKVTRTVEAFKDLALSHHLPAVLVSAVEAAGLDARRVRLHHLRGSSAVAFEADVVIMLNEKRNAVSKIHLSYDTVGAQRFRDWVVWSIEKNRGGPNLVDMEFAKDFAHFRFHPDGGLVTEKLVDERLDEDLF